EQRSLLRHEYPAHVAVEFAVGLPPAGGRFHHSQSLWRMLDRPEVHYFSHTAGPGGWREGKSGGRMLLTVISQSRSNVLKTLLLGGGAPKLLLATANFCRNADQVRLQKVCTYPAKSPDYPYVTGTAGAVAFHSRRIQAPTSRLSNHAPTSPLPQPSS